jgi:MoxR-like ATPase
VGGVAPGGVPAAGAAPAAPIGGVAHDAGPAGVVGGAIPGGAPVAVPGAPLQPAGYVSVGPPAGGPAVPSFQAGVGAPQLAPTGPAFVGAGAIRAAAEGGGLRLPDSVYANVAAGLAAGKHLLLTGAPGAGKTALAMAVARAAAQAGRAHGATVITATTGWDPRALLVEAASRGRWVIADELDRADPDEALGALSSFLAGIPIALGGAQEAAPADGWRIVATWGGGPPRASAAVLRRFAFVEVVGPPADELRAALHQAAGGDVNAAHAAERLLALADLAPLGAGVFIDAARHAAFRRSVAQVDDVTLAREAFAAYVAPLLGDLDEEGQRRVRELLG